MHRAPGPTPFRKFGPMASVCRLLARLRRNDRGNVLAIVGAALVPLTIMIGSGIDLLAQTTRQPTRSPFARTTTGTSLLASRPGRQIVARATLGCRVMKPA